MNKSDKHILIVDDDVSILTACAESLLLDGYQVDVAESGEKALEMVPRKKYHLIVTDLMMGEVDGMQVLRYAKEVSPASEVIVLTAHGSVTSAVEAMKLGAYDYLSKPFDPYRLDTAVKRALEHQTLVRELTGLREVLHLYDASRTLSTVQEEKELLRTMVTCAAEIADADGACMLMASSDGKLLQAAATHGARHGVLKDQSIVLKAELLAGMRLSDIKTLDSPDLRKYLHMDQVAGFADITSALSVPITHQGRLLAVLNLVRVGDQKSAFGEEELRPIAILAAQFGYAIENSRLFVSLRSQSNFSAFARLQEACEKMLTRPQLRDLPAADKQGLEEILSQCRLLAQRNGLPTGSIHPPSKNR